MPRSILNQLVQSFLDGQLSVYVEKNGKGWRIEARPKLTAMEEYARREDELAAQERANDDSEYVPDESPDEPEDQFSRNDVDSEEQEIFEL